MKKRRGGMNTSMYLSDSALRGRSVVSPQGESLGTIKDIALDLETGGIAYAVLSFGGFLNVGSRLHAIPWEALRFDVSGDRIVLDIPKESLENAPGFDEGQWPDHADRTFLDSVYTHYGYTEYETYRDKRYPGYEERRRKMREESTLDVIDPKRDGVS